MAQNGLKIARACKRAVDPTRRCTQNVETATPASADRCVVACMYQKVARWMSDMPCPPLSDLGSALERLGGDVLIPGGMAIFLWDLDRTVATTKVHVHYSSSES